MKWFIQYITIYAPKNKKHKELNMWLESWEYNLLNSCETLNFFVEEVKLTVESLNSAYPKTLPFCVEVARDKQFCNIYVKTSSSIDADICIIMIKRVKFELDVDDFDFDVDDIANKEGGIR